MIALCCLAALGGVRVVLAEEPDSSQPDDAVLATVNGHPISQSDLDRLIVQVKTASEAAGGTGELPEEKVLIEELIRRESVRQFIKTSGVEVEPAAIEAQWKDFEETITEGGRTVEEFLEDRCLTSEEFREIISVQLALEKITESKLTVEKLDLLDEEVRASHILVMTTGAMSDEKAKARILSIKKEIEGGRSFEECAKAYSECPSKEKGGDLGFFPRYGAMVEPFAEAAFALEKGKVSGPVKTAFGYHLIMVTERRKTSDQVKEYAKSQLLREELNTLLEEIEDKVEVERFYETETETGGTEASSSEETE